MTAVITGCVQVTVPHCVLVCWNKRHTGAKTTQDAQSRQCEAVATLLNAAAAAADGAAATQLVHSTRHCECVTRPLPVCLGLNIHTTGGDGGGGGVILSFHQILVAALCVGPCCFDSCETAWCCGGCCTGAYVCLLCVRTPEFRGLTENAVVGGTHNSRQLVLVLLLNVC
jgi:hypothetical protein